MVRCAFLLPGTCTSEQGLCDRSWCPYIMSVDKRIMYITIADNVLFQSTAVNFSRQILPLYALEMVGHHGAVGGFPLNVHPFFFAFLPHPLLI